MLGEKGCLLMNTIPGTMMSDEPYTLTKAQVDALNALPPGVYHVCFQCRKFQPMGETITLTSGGTLCERCV